MSRQEDIELLYSTPMQNKSAIAFNNLTKPCNILNILTIDDIYDLNCIAKDKSLAAKPTKKFDMIKFIMGRRGFKKLASGTNRIVFKFMEDQNFVIKVAYDNVGLSDNLCEAYNQEFLKPFCTKVYEVSPCGTVGMFERVIPIRNRNEFQLVASDIFDIIINHFIGRFILSDFGTKYFMNWGIRRGLHPVILDFPYVYELDGAKIYCNKPDPKSEIGYCGGEIDYDDGFNYIRCKKCGKTYVASELRLAAEKKSKNIILEREDFNMKISVVRGEEVIQSSDRTNETRVYKYDSKGRPKETPLEYRERKISGSFGVSIVRRVEDTVEEEQKEEVTGAINEENTALKDNIAHQREYDGNMFNNGFSLDTVPKVDKIYADAKLVAKDRQGNTIVDDTKAAEEEAERLESILSDTVTAIDPADEEHPTDDEPEKVITNPVIVGNDTVTILTDEPAKELSRLEQAKEYVHIVPREEVTDAY